jgi:siroheme synthase
LTLVILMGLGSRGALAALLIARGWRADTAVAVCLASGTADAYTWIGTIGELGAAALAERPDAPGTIIIGEVVTVGAALAESVAPWPAAVAAG